MFQENIAIGNHADKEMIIISFMENPEHE